MSFVPIFTQLMNNKPIYLKANSTRFGGSFWAVSMMRQFVSAGNRADLLSGFTSEVDMKIKAEIIDQQNLTPREAQILALICEGAPDKVIAQALAISINTVSIHCENLYIKMQVRNNSINVRCAAIGTALVRGMVRLSQSALCVFLMVNAADLDANALRVSARVSVSRLRGRE